MKIQTLLVAAAILPSLAVPSLTIAGETPMTLLEQVERLEVAQSQYAEAFDRNFELYRIEVAQVLVESKAEVQKLRGTRNAVECGASPSPNRRTACSLLSEQIVEIVVGAFNRHQIPSIDLDFKSKRETYGIPEIQRRRGMSEFNNKYAERVDEIYRQFLATGLHKLPPLETDQNFVGFLIDEHRHSTAKTLINAITAHHKAAEETMLQYGAVLVLDRAFYSPLRGLGNRTEDEGFDAISEISRSFGEATAWVKAAKIQKPARQE